MSLDFWEPAIVMLQCLVIKLFPLMHGPFLVKLFPLDAPTYNLCKEIRTTPSPPTSICVCVCVACVRVCANLYFLSTLNMS